MFSLLAGLCLAVATTPSSGLHQGQAGPAAASAARQAEIAAPAPEGGLRHPGAQGGAAPAPAFDPAAAFEPGPWRERLQQKDLAARERALDELVERAMADERVAREVREWARGSDELAWTARLMQRELERRGSSGAWRTFREDGLRGMRERMRGFEERMDRLRAELERDLQGWFDDRAHGGQERRDGGGWQGGGRARTKSIEAREDKDGARVEVRTQDEQGREDVRTYTGRTLEEIYRAHPDLREDSEVRIEMGGPGFGPGDPRRGMDPREGWNPFGLDPWGDMRRGQGGREDQGRWNEPRSDAPRSGAPGEEGGLRRPELGPGGERRPSQGPDLVLAPQRGMLGIVCQPVGEELRGKLGLPVDNGLVVESVVEGSIASAIGLRAGDVVVELNGRSIRSRDDVAAVLAERRQGEDLQVVIVDKDGKRRTLTHRNA
ncbi:MAG: hypothetical protein RL112_1404 [Planctomycetota bacterium]